MDSAIATTNYSVDGVRFTRQVFASFPDRVIVVRLTSDQVGKLAFVARMNSHQASPFFLDGELTPLVSE